MTVVLPKGENETGSNEWADVYANDKALKEAVETLQTEFGAAVKPVTWYTPKIIATEETRENVAFGTLTTKDEITGVVVPSNGKLIVNYRAKAKSSVAGAGRIALFLGATAIGSPTNAAMEGKIEGTAFGTLRTEGNALTFAEAIGTPDVSTGFVIGTALEVSVAAGTYVVSAQYKASSGSVTAKERKLWVEVHGP